MLKSRTSIIRVGLVLTEMYPFYGAVMATETMRLANRYADRQVFDWIFISENGNPTAASNGMSLATTAATDASLLDYGFMIAGYDQDRTRHPRIKGLLRRLNRHGAVIGAVDSGAFLLAEAGLLSGQTVAIHFEAKSSFNQKYPKVRVSDEAVSISPTVMSCAGGALVIKLILAITRQHVSEEIASKIEADLHLPDLVPTRRTAEPRVAARSRPRVDDIVSLMKRTIHAPVSLDDLADQSGFSVRQLTRAFNDRFGVSPIRYYQRVRLAHARQLLYQGTQPISDVAFSCGFTALSAFSRAFKAEFGQSPQKHMNTFRREGFSRIIPAVLRGTTLDLKSSAANQR